MPGGTRRRRAALAACATVVAVAALLTSCAPSTSPRPTVTNTPEPRPTPSVLPTPVLPVVDWQPSGETSVLETGMKAPWSIVELPDGSALISERDSGTVLQRAAAGGLRTVGTVPGVVHQGEGGLLGLAVQSGPDPASLYAYLTTRSDNRVVRMPLTVTAGEYSLGAPTNIITGIPKGTNHNGGRIAFGPDGMLFVTAGDATDTANAQNLKSLGGKILRVTPDGAVPADNPFPGSPVYTFGHRNPQGIAWDAHGTMWASEFGQNTWDELNIITPGADYGWPIVEGIGHDPRFTDPVYQWHTDQASPSGIAIVGDTIFMASLRGERLWTIWTTQGRAPVTVTASFTGQFGRLRAVIAHGSTLWMLTNNTDGRGTPSAGDDKLISVTLVPAGGIKHPG